MIFDRIIRLPWWLFAATALVFLVIATVGGDWAKDRGSAIRAVMERPSAPVIAFAALDPGDAAYAEAAFVAQLVEAEITALVDTSDGDGQRIGTLLPLAAPDAGEAPQAIGAAIILRSGPMRPDWQEWIAPFVTGEGALGSVLSLEGEISRTHELAPVAAASIGERRTGGTIWVGPYRDGREAALERNLGLLGWGALPFWGIGIFFAVMSVARFFASRGG